MWSKTLQSYQYYQMKKKKELLVKIKQGDKDAKRKIYSRKI